MSFNFFQLIPLAFFIALGFSIVYKKHKITIALVFIIVFSLFFMPIKLTQNNIGVYEDKGRFNDLPERVIVVEKSFEDYQKSNMTQLKKESNNEAPK